MRNKKTIQRILITLLTAALLIGVGLATWNFFEGDSSNDSLTTDTATEPENNNVKKTTTEPSDKNEEIDNSEPETVEDNTVAIKDVEFQPLEDSQDPEEVPTLPVTTNHYKIVQLNESFFEVELYAILNKPEQYSEYRAQLKDFKQEALNYLVENDYDIQSSRISYIPAEAADL